MTTTRAPAHHSLRLRPLAAGSLVAITTATGAVLSVLPSADALALISRLTGTYRVLQPSRPQDAPRHDDVAA